MSFLKKLTLKTFFTAILFSLIACTSKISQENFDQVQPGMTMQQVVQILGQPTNVESINIAGISGSSATWQNKDELITIQFFNNQVKIKTLSKATGDANKNLNPNGDANTN